MRRLLGPLLAIAAGLAFLGSELVFMPFILAHTTGAFSVKNGIMGLGGMTVVAVVVVMAGVAALFARPNSN